MSARIVDRLVISFYLVVLGVALAGASTAAKDWLDWTIWVAVPVVAAVELGGVVLSMLADARRQLGERAIITRLLSAAVAVGAVAANWFGHSHMGQAAFFAGMSALGYCVYLLRSAAKRRDALRRAGKLEHTAPVYGAWQWLTHPSVTRRARWMALADPTLGRNGSLDAARAEARRDARQAAISAALRARIRKAAGSTLADIAVSTYDLDEVARRLAEGADYAGLTELLARDLAPARLAAVDEPERQELTAIVDATEPTLDERIESAVARQVESVTPPPTSADVRPRWGKIPARRPRRMGRPLPQITVVVPTPETPALPAGSAAKRQGSAAGRGRPSAAQKVAAAAKKLPGAKTAEIAAAAGVSPDTARRHLNGKNLSELEATR